MSVEHTIYPGLDREFQRELDSFFAGTEVAGELEELREFPGGDPRSIYRLLGDAGLLAPSWPVRYGGRGLGQLQECQLIDGLVRAGCPDTLYITSLQVTGNVLLHHASEDLRSRFLPEFAGGRRFASVLFSELSAGSDLAGIATTGVPADSGDWLVSGHKVWTARTPLATDALCVFRSDGPGTRYDSLALALISLEDPRVRIRALETLGSECLHEVFLDAVPVAADRIIALPGQAWPIVSGSISYERTGFDYVARAGRWLSLCRPSDPADAVEFALLGDRYQHTRFLAFQVAELVDRGVRDDSDAALVKLLSSELAQDCAYFAEKVVAPNSDAVSRAVDEAPGLSISAGASEILIDLVASTLPDSGLFGVDR